MDDDELAGLGANSSLIHVDWMIGTAQMDVDGIATDGTGRAADARRRVGLAHQETISSKMAQAAEMWLQFQSHMPVGGYVACLLLPMFPQAFYLNSIKLM